MEPITKIVLAIVVILAIAYGVVAVLSSDDGIPDESGDAMTEAVAPE